MSRLNFKPVIENEETGWSNWIFPVPNKPYRMKCCDCGLVHDMEFQAATVERKRGGWVNVKETLPVEETAVMLRARRNERMTKNERAKDEEV